MAGSLIQERELLEAARGGDERAFQSLVAPRHDHPAPDAVQLDIEPHNVASQRVARGLGGRPTGRVSRTAAGRRVMFERYTIDPSQDVGRQAPSGPGGAGTIAT
jgi:hypothetical protein